MGELDATLTKAHKEYEKGLRHYSIARLHSPEMADDVVADAFMKTWVYLKKGGKITLMKAFLYHITNCLIVDQYRKRKTVSLDILSESGFEPSVDDSNRLLDTIDGQEAVRLMDYLPEKYKKVLSLRYLRNLSIKEIAQKTHQSDNTVVVQIHRGLKKLKSLYDGVRPV